MSIAVRKRLSNGEITENGVVHSVSLEKGIPRRSTAEALELISRSETQSLAHSAWYEPGKDFW